MGTPRVSIGMTVDNGAAHLKAALDGLLNQTFGDFELIISDDGSSDESESICRDYATHHPRIRYYRENENRGPFWNTNRVFELSRGEYFKWSTHDDVSAPTFLARCVELLDGDASLAWCHTLTSHIDESGRVLPAVDDPDIPEGQAAFSLVANDPESPKHTRRSARPHERFSGVVLGSHWCSDGYGLFRSEAVRRTRLLLPCYGAGKVLIAEVALQGRFEEVPEVLFFDHLRETATADQMTAVQREAFIGPTTPVAMAVSRLRLLHEYVRAIRHAGLPLAEQLRCMAVLVR
jgi:glycosyltransferase involved in cell wall biosynthesis